MSGRIEVWEVFSYLLPPTSYLLKRELWQKKLKRWQLQQLPAKS